MGLLSELLTPSTGAESTAYGYACTAMGHAYLGAMLGLPLCLWLGWWGVAPVLALAAAKAALNYALAAPEREGARGVDAAVDVAAWLPGALCGALAVSGLLWWSAGALAAGAAYAGAVGVVWGRTNRDAR